MKIDAYCQQQKTKDSSLVSGNIRFVRIFEGFPGKGASNDSGTIFSSSGRYIGLFSTVRDKANVII